MKSISLLTVIILVFQANTSQACFSNSIWGKEPALNGTINKLQLDKNVAIYHYRASPDFVSSFIIELPKRLIIFDTQFVLPHAREVLIYAQYLRKPISRVYISHGHPDHYFGIEVFKSKAQVYALAETIQRISTNGQPAIDRNKAALGDLIPDTPTLPDKIQVPGDEVIDGVLFQFRKFETTETDFTLVLMLPKYETMLVGDIVFNKEHLFLAEKHFDTWIQVLKGFQINNRYKNVLMGHGENGDYSLFQENIDYLEYAKQLIDKSNDFDYFKAKLVNKYPSYAFADFIDFFRATFPKQVSVPSSVVVPGSDCYPQGIAIWNANLYVGCLKSGEIQIVDLRINTVSGKFDLQNGLASTWGLHVDTVKDWLYSCRNPTFGASDTFYSEIQAFDLTNGQFAKSWKLLKGSRCDSLTQDERGDLYIADGYPRILKIDMKTDTVTIWKTSALWVASNGFGVSGVVYANSAIYANGAGNFLYKISIKPDGSAGSMVPVMLQKTDGNEFTMNGIHGLTFVAGNNNLLLTNMLPRPQGGILYKVQLDQSGTSGVVSEMASNLTEPAVVRVYNQKAFVSISQLGLFFGLRIGNPTLPFTISTFSFN